MTLNAKAQEYALYDSEGKEVKLKKAIKQGLKADVVLFGELHDDSTCHSVQLEFLKGLVEGKKEVVFGLEMLEADNQIILDEYQNGLIAERYFNREARLWPNYKTDYAPMVNFAVENKIKVVATNVPRRYASTLATKGMQSLNEFSETAKKWIAPIPFPFDSAAPGYAEMMQMDFGHSGGNAALNMVQAQAVKDATMAWFIDQNLPKRGVFYHIQGDFHSANKGGIGWYLREYKAAKNILVISTVRAKKTKWQEEYTGRGDFVLVTKEVAGN